MPKKTSTKLAETESVPTIVESVAAPVVVTEKKVKKDTLQSYLDDGWQLGGKKRKIA